MKMVARGNARGGQRRGRGLTRGQRADYRSNTTPRNDTDYRISKTQLREPKERLRREPGSRTEQHSLKDGPHSSPRKQGPDVHDLPGLEKLHDTIRTKASLSSCSDLSLYFVSVANLDTDEDTNIIALNLMDYFLFSEENWIPELSYCHLHGACFMMASLITGKSNTAEQIAASLSSESEFVRSMASPLAEDDGSVASIARILGIDTSDVDRGYRILFERRDQLAGLTGNYSDRVANLPESVSQVVDQEKDAAVIEEVDFDILEE